MRGICTIPIEEVFSPKEGCPICRLRSMLDERCTEYILGPALMEPDVRNETDAIGFCHYHYEKLLHGNNMLGLSLLLKTHLYNLQNGLMKHDNFSKKSSDKFNELQNSCFICNQIERYINDMVKTIIISFRDDEDFRKLYKEQEFICLKDYNILCSAGLKNLNSKDFKLFRTATYDLTKNYLDSLQSDVAHFGEMFDYHNSGSDADWGNSKDSLQRAVKFLNP